MFVYRYIVMYHGGLRSLTKECKQDFSDTMPIYGYIVIYHGGLRGSLKNPSKLVWYHVIYRYTVMISRWLDWEVHDIFYYYSFYRNNNHGNYTLHIKTGDTNNNEKMHIFQNQHSSLRLSLDK